ncbi:MAG: urease accessory protein UreF [Bauldia sp.]|nr:urease accessory protein UreF [Bauldia sp.]
MRSAGDSLALLRALQHGDSAFPSGGFAFSQGLEGLAALDGKPDASRVAAFLNALVVTRWTSFDRVALVRAHRAEGIVGAIAEIDAEMEAASVVEPLRTGSRRHGGAFLAAHTRLGTPGASDYRALIAQGEAFGHLPVMQGFLWHGAGIDEATAVALSGYGLAAGIVSAAIRLGLVGAIDGQRIITEAIEGISAANGGEVAAGTPLAGFSPHAELAALHQARSDMRLFSN